MRLSIRFLLIALIAVGPYGQQLALAWGDNGHIAVAKVADKYLTANARQKIGIQLGNKSIYARSICMYADSFKHTDGGKFTKPWHYVDIPFSEAGYLPTRDCSQDNCVVAQIRLQSKILKDTTQSDARRIQALKFLVHFVGDSHQPLHCSERNNDHGGNDVHVRFLDRAGITNLHSVWDDLILDENMQAEDPEDYADTIQARITTQEKTQWEQVGDPIEWVNEGHKLAHDFSYDGIPASTQQPFKIEQSYVTRAQPVVEEQIQKAGVRLAKILNDILQ